MLRGDLDKTQESKTKKQHKTSQTDAAISLQISLRSKQSRQHNRM
jgi:hypothetical protein